MTEVLRWRDTRNARWARFIMDNGDPCWLSVAQAGVLVKKSRLGILGAKLYEQGNVYGAGQDAARLAETFPDVAPKGMTNLVLRAFTSAVLHCHSLAEVTRVLNEKPQSQASNRSGPSSAQIISDFAQLLTEEILTEETPSPLTFYDVSRLPHPKNTIRDVLLAELRATVDKNRRNALEVCLITLPCYQSGVGEKPLAPLPNLPKIPGRTVEEIRETASKIATWARSEERTRWDKFNSLADKEREELKRLIKEAKASA